MWMKRPMQWIFAISVVGIVFSGTLTYREVFAGTAPPGPAPRAHVNELGNPTGLKSMHISAELEIISGGALWKGRHPQPLASY
jgi:hypothetical protein